MKYAAIDIGSNSVRLLIQSDGKTLYKTLNSTRLGEGLIFTQNLSAAAMERSALAVKEFKEKAVALGCQKIYVFATAAVRAAKNGGAFVALVKQLANLEVDVISGEEEAAIGLLGAIGTKDGGIIDIGGGSTELTLRVDGAVCYSKSLEIGAVRLYDLCGRNKQALHSYVQETIKNYGQVQCNVPVYGIGGTATSIAALALGLKPYDGERIQNFKLYKERLKEVLAKLFEASPQEIAQNSCLPLKRAEIIAGGGVILWELMEYLHLPYVTISEKDNLDGYLLKRIANEKNHG